LYDAFADVYHAGGELSDYALAVLEALEAFDSETSWEKTHSLRHALWEYLQAALDLGEDISVTL